MRDKSEDQKKAKEIRQIKDTNSKLKIAVAVLATSLVFSIAIQTTVLVLMNHNHKEELHHIDELQKARLTEINDKNLALINENNDLKKTNKSLEKEINALKKHTEQLQSINEQQKEIYKETNPMTLMSAEEYVLQASRRMVVPVTISEGSGLSRITAQVKSGNKLDFYLMSDEENAEKFKKYQIITMISSANKTHSYEITDLFPAGTYYLGIADSSWGILSESQTDFVVSVYSTTDIELTKEDYTGTCSF